MPGRVILTVVLFVSAGVTWAGVIAVALHVSSIVLKTLEQIVELAALT
jgi:type IV secretory pathway VirB3-like protein